MCLIVNNPVVGLYYLRMFPQKWGTANLQFAKREKETSLLTIGTNPGFNKKVTIMVLAQRPTRSLLPFFLI